MKLNYNISPKKIHNNVIAFYNKDDKYFNKLRDQRPLKYRAIFGILDSLNNKNVKILDVGCGTGNLVLFISNKGYKNIEGLDDCKRFIEITKKFKNIKFRQEDILNFDSKDSYDIIIATDFIEHSIYPGKVIKKVAYLLRGRGMFIIQGPNLLQLLSKNVQFDIRQIYYFIMKLIQYSFRKIRIQYLNPKLDNDTHKIDDADACYLINPFDMIYLLKKNKFSIIALSTFYNPMERMKKFKKLIAIFLARIPIIKYFGGTLLIISITGDYNLEQQRKIKEVIQSMY